MPDKIPENEIDQDLASLESKWNTLAIGLLLIVVLLILGGFIADKLNLMIEPLIADSAIWAVIISLIGSMYYGSKQSKAEEQKLRRTYNDIIDAEEDSELNSILEETENRLFSNKETKKLVKDLKKGADIKEDKFEDLKTKLLTRIREHDINYKFDKRLESFLDKEDEEEKETFQRALLYDIYKRTDSADLETRDLAVLVGAVLLIPTTYLAAEYYDLSQVYKLATIGIGLIPAYYTMKMYRANQ